MRTRPTYIVLLTSALSLLLVALVLAAAGLLWNAVPLVVLLAILLGLFLAVNLYNALSRRAFSLWTKRDHRRHGDLSRGR